MKNEVDIINKNRLLAKNKTTSTREYTVQTTSNSTSKQNNILDLTPPILTPTNPIMYNPADVINKLKRKYDICDNLFKISGVLSKQKQNPLNKFCYSCYLKSNRETLLSE